MKHVESRAHNSAVSLEKDLEGNEEPSSSTSHASAASDPDRDGPPKKQPRIDDMIRQNARSAYRKLLVTAYMVAVDGAPLKCK